MRGSRESLGPVAVLLQGSNGPSPPDSGLWDQDQ